MISLPLGLYVPCCRIWAGRAAGQRGQEMITATSYPCLPRAAVFISLIPIPAFSLLLSLLFSLEGSFAEGWCLLQAAFHALGDQHGCPLAAPHGAALCFWVQWVLLAGGWGPHICQGGRGVLCAAWGGPHWHVLANSPAKAPPVPNCLFLLHPLRQQRAWPGPALGQVIPAAVDPLG